jgi:UDP:flavonoid glycosyltransferase YjiC (YdhE family)
MATHPQPTGPTSRHGGEPTRDQALGPRPAHLVTTGPEVDPAAIPGTPRVQVIRSAPHSAVLPRAAVVINHGGHGIVTKAIAAGLPQLAIPLGRDQPNNAARVHAAGVGLRLKKYATPATISTAVRRLLDEPAFRTRAEQLGLQLRTDACSNTAITELEHLARHGKDQSAINR